LSTEGRNYPRRCISSTPIVNARCHQLVSAVDHVVCIDWGSCVAHSFLSPLPVSSYGTSCVRDSNITAPLSSTPLPPSSPFQDFLLTCTASMIPELPVSLVYPFPTQTPSATMRRRSCKATRHRPGFAAGVLPGVAWLCILGLLMKTSKYSMTAHHRCSVCATAAKESLSEGNGRKETVGDTGSSVLPAPRTCTVRRS
jgi:hypothetical protein